MIILGLFIFFCHYWVRVMKGGSKGKLAKPRDFQRNPFVIFGEPLTESGFGGGVGGIGVCVGAGVCSCIFVCVCIGGDRFSGEQLVVSGVVISRFVGTVVCISVHHVVGFKGACVGCSSISRVDSVNDVGIVVVSVVGDGKGDAVAVEKLGAVMRGCSGDVGAVYVSASGLLSRPRFAVRHSAPGSAAPFRVCGIQELVIGVVGGSMCCHVRRGGRGHVGVVTVWVLDGCGVGDRVGVRHQNVVWGVKTGNGIDGVGALAGGVRVGCGDGADCDVGVSSGTGIIKFNSVVGIGVRLVCSG